MDLHRSCFSGFFVASADKTFKGKHIESLLPSQLSHVKSLEPIRGCRHELNAPCPARNVLLISLSQ